MHPQLYLKKPIKNNTSITIMIVYNILYLLPCIVFDIVVNLVTPPDIQRCADLNKSEQI